MRPPLPLCTLVLAASLGSPSSGQRTVLQRLDGFQASEEFGASVAGGRDVDGDGVPDVVVGSPRSDVAGLDRGTVRVLSGLDGSVLHTWHGMKDRAGLGISVTTLPDLNGDGCAEVVTGSWYQPAPSESGVVTVRSGQDGAILHQWSSTPGTFFGAAVDDVGDLDGDGLHDLAVGAHIDSTQASHGGAVFLYSGGSGALIRAHYGSTNSGWFGHGVTGGKDFTGDGVPDYAVGSSLDQGGRVDLYSGANGSHQGFLAPAGSGQFGRFVELSDDIDGDGLAEIFVSSPNGGPATRVYSGSDLSLLHTFDGAGIGGLFGFSIACPGDVDLDGVPDFVVGAFGFEAARGLLEVYSGANGAPIHRQYGWKSGAYFGASIEAAGDLDGDGRGDLVVGCAPPHSSTNESGWVRVIAGGCVGEATAYGAGLAGSGNIVPTLDALGCPALNADFGIEIADVLGNTRGQLLIGFAPANLDAFGGTILVTPPGIRIPLSFPGVGPGAGARTLSTRLPDDDAYVGVRFFLQVLAFDAGAPAGVSMSPGLDVTIR